MPTCSPIMSETLQRSRVHSMTNGCLLPLGCQIPLSLPCSLTMILTLMSYHWKIIEPIGLMRIRVHHRRIREAYPTTMLPMAMVQDSFGHASRRPDKWAWTMSLINSCVKADLTRKERAIMSLIFISAIGYKLLCWSYLSRCDKMFEDLTLTWTRWHSYIKIAVGSEWYVFPSVTPHKWVVTSTLQGLALPKIASPRSWMRMSVLPRSRSFVA